MDSLNLVHLCFTVIMSRRSCSSTQKQNQSFILSCAVTVLIVLSDVVVFSVNVKCIQQNNLDILRYSFVQSVSPIIHINEVRSHKHVKNSIYPVLIPDIYHRIKIFMSTKYAQLSSFLFTSCWMLEKCSKIPLMFGQLCPQLSIRLKKSDSADCSRLPATEVSQDGTLWS